MAAGRARELERLRKEIRTHSGCGFEPCETCTNMVPGEGPAGAALMFVGEAPGGSEDKQGRPFVGRAGKLLDELLAEAGLGRDDVYITNVVKARPPGNRDPKAPEVAHHLPWLEAELALVAPRLVVPLGRHALAHFAPKLKISAAHGQLVTERERPLYPMYHPAAALNAFGARREQVRTALFEDARGLGEALASV